LTHAGFLRRACIGSVAALWALAALTAATAYAADDAVTLAIRLHEKRHYEDAARTLRPALSSLAPARQGAAYLTLGIIYLRNAELHHELHRVGIAVQLGYLKKLVAARGRDGSRFADLYLGEALLESGSPGEAAKHLEQFMAQAAVGPRYKAIARASLGLSHFQRQEVRKAQALWAGIDTADPEVKAELAAVYSAAGLQDKNPVAMSDAALKDSGLGPSPRMRRNLLRVYASAGLTDKGLDLLSQADLKTASYAEVLGKTKTINFYDLSLLADLAMLYGQTSLAYLEKAAGDARLKGTADYYLGEAHANAGSVEPSLRAVGAFLSLAEAPPQYRDRARVRQAANEYRRGQRAEAMAAWDALAQRQPADPDLLAETILACVQVKADCPKIEPRAALAAETGRGKAFSLLNFALGRYHLWKKDYAKAISYMEAGRDKSNKNKIEANDPVLLVSLADAYYRTKQFSESLEIYFEMSKQFPVVRQIQEALQGVYSIEHKSAGDVKIF